MQINDPFFNYSLNCAGKLLTLYEPVIMGILNLTDDSFYDGGKYNSLDAAIAQTEKMIHEGAQIIDIGAASSKPGASVVPMVDEQKKIKLIAKALVSRFADTVFSIDTTSSIVAQTAIDEGCSMINDVSGGCDDAAMYRVAAANKVPYIMMHRQGIAATMQLNPNYENVVLDIADFYKAQIPKARDTGMLDVIIDVGFGFGKSITHNYQLLNMIDFFHQFNCPLLAGVSRKSMLYKPLHIEPAEALSATTYLHSKLLDKGVQLYRVHDVQAMQQAITLQKLIKQNKP
jgi:dihydropteroate synthase